MSALKVQQGSILVYRLFDVGEEISLTKVRSLVEQADSESPKKRSRYLSQVKLDRRRGAAVMIQDPPLAMDLGEMEHTIGGKPLKLETMAKVWSYGVISITFTLPIRPGTRWDRLIGEGARIELDASWDEQARELAHSLAGELKSAIQGPNSFEIFEDYQVYFLQKIDGIETGDQLLQSAPIPELILAETQGPLAPSIRQSLLSSAIQYAVDDLSVIDWDSAVVYEPSGVPEVPLVLEFALTQMLEFRFYDNLLDRQLETLYEAVSNKKRRRQLAKLSGEATARFIEFAKFTERAENSLKVIGDSYLALVFRRAVTQFRLSDWRANITRKMSLLAQTSELLSNEASTRLSHWMELIIIILIAVEIVGAALKLL